MIHRRVGCSVCKTYVEIYYFVHVSFWFVVGQPAAVSPGRIDSGTN